MRVFKVSLVFGLSLMMALSFMPMIGAQQSPQPPQVFVNGRVLEPDIPPRIEEGRTLVEMRSIFEALGAVLQWDEETRVVRASKGDINIELTIDEKTATVRGEPVALDVPAQIENGRTVIPLRFVSESLGAVVDWNGETRTVTIAVPELEPEVVPAEEVERLPAEIEEWVEYSRTIPLAQAREYEDFTYLLVTYGEKRTGGYSVDITRVLEYENEIEVTVNFSEPAEGEPVTQAFTYPYDLMVIKAADKPVQFVAEGDEEFVPTLFGIDYLRPVVAQSRGIMVFSPAPDTSVPAAFAVEGVANVFEGTVQYRLTNGEGLELDSGFTTGSMGDWGYFNPELTVPEEVEDGEMLLLELYTESAKDGSIEDLIEIELIYEEDAA